MNKRTVSGIGAGCCLLWLLAGFVATAQAAQATRVSAFGYDTNTGLLTKEVIEPGNYNFCLVTEYVYDVFGNKKTATTRNCDGSAINAGQLEAQVPTPTGPAAFVSRTTSAGWATDSGGSDAQGRFPTKSTNALGHFETKGYDAQFGVVTSLTGPNNLPTTWTYDSFGRKKSETRADGTKTEWDYLYCSGVGTPSVTCPSGLTNAKYLVQTTPKDSAGAQSGPISKVYYDALNREIRAEVQGFDGTLVFKDTIYDDRGRVLRVSQPYYSTGTAKWSCVAYDDLNRVTLESRPTDTNDNASCNSTVQTTSAYNGLTTTVTNALGQTETRYKNSQGQLIKVTRP